MCGCLRRPRPRLGVSRHDRRHLVQRAAAHSHAARARARSPAARARSGRVGLGGSGVQGRRSLQQAGELVLRGSERRRRQGRGRQAAMTTVAPPLAASRRRLERILITIAPLGGVVAVLVLAAVTTPGFYTRANLTLVLFQAGIIGVTAVGQTLVLLVGGIDLSIGAVIGLTTVIVASRTAGSDAQLPTAIALAAAAGLAVGLVNAALVLVRQVPPFVATFATFVLVQGGITAWTRGAPSGDIPRALGPLGSGRVAGLPVPLWIFAVLAVVTGVVLSRTTLGRRIYAAGANRQAADMSAIRTGRVIAIAYVASALLAVLAGLIDAGYVGHVDAQLSRSLNLDSVAAAVIGGIALTGGRGNIGQTISGVMLLAVLLVWMVQLGAGPGGQLVVEGAAILLAAWLQQPEGGHLRRGLERLGRYGFRLRQCRAGTAGLREDLADRGAATGPVRAQAADAQRL